MSVLQAAMLKMLAELRIWGDFDDALKKHPQIKQTLREIDKLMLAYGETKVRKI